MPSAGYALRGRAAHGDDRVAERVDASRLSSSRQAVRFCERQRPSLRSALPGRQAHKQGSPYLRWALFEAAQSACRRRSPDHADYLELKERIDATGARVAHDRALSRRCVHTLRELGPAGQGRTNGLGVTSPRTSARPSGRATPRLAPRKAPTPTNEDFRAPCVNHRRCPLTGWNPHQALGRPRVRCPRELSNPDRRRPSDEFCRHRTPTSPPSTTTAPELFSRRIDIRHLR
jgi:hypothetical protein